MVTLPLQVGKVNHGSVPALSLAATYGRGRAIARSSANASEWPSSRPVAGAPAVMRLTCGQSAHVDFRTTPKALYDMNSKVPECRIAFLRWEYRA
jgi:hypothetical protein